VTPLGLPISEAFTLGLDRLLEQTPTWVLLFVCGECALTACASVFVESTRAGSEVTWAKLKSEADDRTLAVGPFIFNRNQYVAAMTRVTPGHVAGGKLHEGTRQLPAKTPASSRPHNPVP